MKKFSLKRVVEYLRYIYTVQAKNYAWNVLAMLFVQAVCTDFITDMMIKQF